MKRFVCCFLIAILATCLTVAAPRHDRMVVVISLDGFPSYALDDPYLPIPTIRQLMRDGAAAASMRPTNPTVTWPSHTSMVTGVDGSHHQVLFNGLLTPPSAGRPGKIEPWLDKDKMVRAVTVYDIAHKAGMTTAEVDWVAIYGARSITWKFPELPDPDGAIEKELIARNVVSRDQLVNFRKAPITWRDGIWTEAAIHILTAHKPNLMLFHVLNMDSTHHRYGPMELASYNAFAFADNCVKQIRDALEKARLLDRTTLLVVSDHGFRTVNKLIHAEAVLESKGVSGAWVVPEGGTAMAYVTDPAERAALVPRIADAFRGVEGVEAVIGRDEFRRLGLNPDSKESPDLVLAAKPGYAFAGGKVSSASPFRGGSHGYLNTDSQMDAIFVAWGTGIRRGARLGQVSVMDVGPTIAKLLGLDMKDVQGRVLREILE